MKPILISTDSKQANEVIKEKSVYLEDFNEILSEYENLGLPTLTGEEFQSLVKNPQDTIHDKMTGGETLTFAGMSIDRTKAMEMVKKPDGYEGLIALIESFKKHRPGWLNSLVNIDIVDGETVLNADFIKATEKAANIYLTTECEKKLHDFAKAVIDAAGQHLGNVKYSLSELIERTIDIRANPANPADRSYIIKPRSFGGFQI